jgi:hypothetical protein
MEYHAFYKPTFAQNEVSKKIFFTKLLKMLSNSLRVCRTLKLLWCLLTGTFTVVSEYCTASVFREVY